MPLALEVCVDNIASAVNAAAGGADRLELCQELSVGGLTPTAGLIKMVKSAVHIPVFVLIRPRAGNFQYSEQEVQQMEEDIQVSLDNEADGFVFGALTRDYQVDKETCLRLMKRTYCRPLTFHRAFDMSGYPEQALEDIIDLGFSRVLTSGFAPTAHIGMLKVKEVMYQAGPRIIVMPGSGITNENLEEIVSTTQAKEYHSSGIKKDSKPVRQPCVIGTAYHNEASYAIVRRMKDVLKSHK